MKKKAARKPVTHPCWVLVLIALIALWVGVGRQGEDESPSEPDISQTGSASVSETAGESSEPSEPTEPEGISLPAGTEDWQLVLVNPWNPLPDDYDVELVSLPNGLRVDERCYDDLMQMLRACEAAGCSPIVCSAYRTVEYQTTLYDNKVRNLISQGYSEAEARQTAATIVAYPGTSEHHLGLAVDIVDAGNQLLNESQEQTATQKWLLENC